MWAVVIRVLFVVAATNLACETVRGVVWSTTSGIGTCGFDRAIVTKVQTFLVAMSASVVGSCMIG